MSWSSRDHQQHAGPRLPTPGTPPVTPETPPHETLLPLEALAWEVSEEDVPAIPLWYRRHMRSQGLMDAHALDRWAHIMRRGVQEIQW